MNVEFVKLFFRGFYEVNKYGLNFYWLLFILGVFGSVEVFAWFMVFVSFCYMISNVVWFVPDIIERR